MKLSVEEVYDMHHERLANLPGVVAVSKWQACIAVFGKGPSGWSDRVPKELFGVPIECFGTGGVVSEDDKVPLHNGPSHHSRMLLDNLVYYARVNEGCLHPETVKAKGELADYLHELEVKAQAIKNLPGKMKSIVTYFEEMLDVTDSPGTRQTLERMLDLAQETFDQLPK